ncbi:(4Fe-4S)-binding protein [Sphingobacterium sp. JB170]|uniref:(4Fe-4S)-binding protein n=1 Tax=Sphingobacterium sp. JB170 TaxID=1434842 RepID=UPI00358E1E1C
MPVCILQTRDEPSTIRIKGRTKIIKTSNDGNYQRIPKRRVNDSLATKKVYPCWCVCVKTLPNVYDPKAKRWIATENASIEDLKNQIDTCPSGALSYRGS